MNPPVCMCLCMYICASLEGLCHFAQSLQLIKTCSISCLSICLLISGSYAFRSHLTGNLLPYYSCRLRLFPVTLIFFFFFAAHLRCQVWKDVVAVSADVRDSLRISRPTHLQLPFITPPSSPSPPPVPCTRHGSRLSSLCPLQ